MGVDVVGVFYFCGGSWSIVFVDNWEMVMICMLDNFEFVVDLQWCRYVFDEDDEEVGDSFGDDGSFNEEDVEDDEEGEEEDEEVVLGMISFVILLICFWCVNYFFLIKFFLRRR